MSTAWQQQREEAEKAAAATLARMKKRDAQHWAEQGEINGDLITGVEQLGVTVRGHGVRLDTLDTTVMGHTETLGHLVPTVAGHTDDIRLIEGREGVVRAAVNTLNSNVSSVATHSTINASEINKLKRGRVDWFTVNVVAAIVAIIAFVLGWWMLVGDLSDGVGNFTAMKGLKLFCLTAGSAGIAVYIASFIFKKKVTPIVEDVLGTPVHLNEPAPIPTRTSGVPARPNPPPPTLAPAEGPVLRLFNEPQRV